MGMRFKVLTWTKDSADDPACVEYEDAFLAITHHRGSVILGLGTAIHVSDGGDWWILDSRAAFVTDAEADAQAARMRSE